MWHKGPTVHTVQSILTSFFSTSCHSVVTVLPHLRVVLGRDATSIPLLFSSSFPSPRLTLGRDQRRRSLPVRLVLGRDTMSLSLHASFWETGTRHDAAVPPPLVLDMLRPFADRCRTRRHVVSLHTSFWDVTRRRRPSAPLSRTLDATQLY